MQATPTQLYTAGAPPPESCTADAKSPAEESSPVATTNDKHHKKKDGEVANSGGGASKDERIRLIKERQNEERQKKLEELKNHALSAQKFREQQEEERKRRIEELRTKDAQKQTAVLERRHAIETAERSRREAILKKSQERESRVEIKRRSEASNIFAFGSSTPRLLNTPGDVWTSGHRRSTSTSNIVGLFPVTASHNSTASVRDVEDRGKRATSAHGLDRKSDAMSTSMYGVFQWDDGHSGSGGRSSPHAKYGTCTEPATPVMARSRASSIERPHIKMSSSKSEFYPIQHGSDHRLPLSVFTAKRPNRNASSFVCGDTSAPGGDLMTRSMSAATTTRARRRTDLFPVVMNHHRESSSRNKSPGSCTPSSPSRPTSSLSTASSTVTTPGTQAAVPRRPRTSPRKPRPASIAAIPLTGTASHPERKPSKGRTPADVGSAHSAEKSPQRRPSADQRPTPPKRSLSKPAEKTSKPADKPAKPAEKTSKPAAPKTPDKTKPKPEKEKAKLPKSNSRGSLPDVVNSPAENKHSSSDTDITSQPQTVPNNIESAEDGDVEAISADPATECSTEPPAAASTENIAAADTPVAVAETPVAAEVTEPVADTPPPKHNSSPSPPPASPPGEKVETKKSAAEEAKARLAEKRRQAREEARLKEELQRQKEEEERLAEEERERKEEEEQRIFEEEQMKMMEEARKAEEERLEKAIEENRLREEEEEERKRVEEEARLERIKEEEKAKEEAEKARIANEARLAKEEEDRIARKKRVEAIMSRTRGAKSNKTSPAEETAPSTPSIPACMTQSMPAPSPSTNGLGLLDEPMNTLSDSADTSPEQPTCDPVKPDLLGDIVLNTTVNNSDVEKLHNLYNNSSDMFQPQLTNGQKLVDTTNLNNVNLLDSPISEQQVSSKQSALESALDCEQLISTDDNQNQSNFSPDPIVAFTESPRQNAPPSIDLLS